LLDKELNDCGKVLLRLEPRYAESGPTADQKKAEVQVSGDGYFPSSHFSMQQLNPVVYSMTVTLSDAHNCLPKK
jgi:hypothetical protein